MKALSKNSRSQIISLLVDIVFINLALAGGYILYPRGKEFLLLVGSFWSFYRTFAPLTTVIRLFFLFFFGLYEPRDRMPAYEVIEKIFKATTLSTILIFTIIQILRSYYFVQINLSRYICFFEWGLNILFLFGWRMLFFYLTSKTASKERSQRNTLILGESSDGVRYFEEMEKIPFKHWNVVGYLASRKVQDFSFKYLDNIGNFLEVVNRYAVRNVIFASKDFSPDQLEKLIVQCDALGIRIFILPTLYEMFAGKLKLQSIEAMPIFEVILEPIDGFNQLLKRFFDILFSLAAIVIFSPIMLIIALAVKLTSKGPILFKQIRIGKDNKPFMLYKFRSMVDNAEQNCGPVWATDDDPRLTPLGGFLRKTSLDELPQLFLVLWGKLSVVGPRPERPHFVNKYKDFQGLRLRIKPGLTGLAQVNGRYEATLANKIYHDIFYINNYSFYLDMVIIIKTIWAVFTAQGAR